LLDGEAVHRSLRRQVHPLEGVGGALRAERSGRPVEAAASAASARGEPPLRPARVELVEVAVLPRPARERAERARIARRPDTSATCSPMPLLLWVRPIRASATCRGPASWRSWAKTSAAWATPVAPSGWPQPISPPRGFTTTSPP